MTNDPRDARIRKLEHRMNDMVHKAELRELIEEWRGTNAELKDSMADERERIARLECADELEALINE